MKTKEQRRQDFKASVEHNVLEIGKHWHLSPAMMDTFFDSLTQAEQFIRELGCYTRRTLYDYKQGLRNKRHIRRYGLFITKDRQACEEYERWWKQRKRR